MAQLPPYARIDDKEMLIREATNHGYRTEVTEEDDGTTLCISWAHL